MTQWEGHTPVLYGETLALLRLQPGDVAVDGTLGGAGHARGMLERILPDGMLIGIDQDAAAIARCETRLASFAGSIRLVHGDFKTIGHVLESLGVDGIDAALLDLGVSSFQLDEGERGFSYMQDAPLDMRMNRDNKQTAAAVVNEYPEEELNRVIREYGEERWAARIAKFIAEERAKREIKTTGDLVRIVKAAVPRGAREGGPHPAKRTFQAIRIEVNGELRGLEQALRDYAQALRPGGRLAVITFHSLEDRIVKQTFQRLYNPCECPKDFPVCVCGKTRTVDIVTRKPVTPDQRETEDNPRARSAKLRVIEKLEEKDIGYERDSTKNASV